jgi:8-oxo-dGTP pyrophosphatase MutT (NUDIX family)
MFVAEAGAVTFRKNEKSIEFLVLRSKKDPAKWIFPKGHIEQGEIAQEAATRELEEEAGIVGRNICFLGALEFLYEQNTFNVQYFLHEYIRVKGPGEIGRDPCWYSFDDTCRILSFKECIQLVEKAMKVIH